MPLRYALLLPLFVLLSSIALAQVTVRDLHPYPKCAFDRPGSFGIRPTTRIVVPDSPDSITSRAAAYLQRLVRERMGYVLSIVPASALQETRDAILLGELSSYDAIRDEYLRSRPPGESIPGSNGEGPLGYVLDILPERAIIVGGNPDLIFNGVATLMQLTSPGDVTMFVSCAHVYDFPDYPIRWVFSQHNLRGANAIVNLKRIQDTMAYYKMNGLQQNDFKYNILAQQPRNYFDSVSAFKANAAASNTAIIPGVAPIGWSDGLLWHDPNLAEGFQAITPYVIEGDTGRLLADPRVTIPNGNFESVGSNGKLTGWSFYDEGSVTVDRSIFHGGAASARCSDFATGNAAGNCRFNRRVDCNPHRYYVMSAWVRTEDLSCDEVRLLAIGQDDNSNSRVLTFTAFNIPATTNGWTRVEVVFNTLEFNHVLLYAGIWGGKSGTIWWDDFEIRDGGLTNILRRDGTPLHVRSKNTTGGEYREGRDFAPIVDSIMLKSNGSYGPYHTPPTLRRLPDGVLANGDTVLVSYFHPVTTVSDNNGNGSVMVCISEDTLYTLLEDQFRRVDTLYSPESFFLGHDEIRSMNRDSACLGRGLTPAQLLADNLKRCLALIEKVHPGAKPFVWSDMFDSLHNAHDDYYLINGDLTGIWNEIPRTPVIVNWNGGQNRDASLRGFDGLGFWQIASPYYDAGNADGIRAWRLSMEKVRRMLGMMYTTWNGDYRFLRPFAYYAWGAGPYIIHTPLDTSVLPATKGETGPVRFTAEVLHDPYDPADRIDSAHIRIIPWSGDEMPSTGFIVPLADSAGLFVGTYDSIKWQGFRYQVAAFNSQGLKRQTPWYYVYRTGFASAPREHSNENSMAIDFRPNPASSTAHISFTMPRSGTWEMRLVDLLGNIVRTEQGRADAGERRTLTLDLEGLANGLYRCEISTPDTTAGRTVIRF